ARGLREEVPPELPEERRLRCRRHLHARQVLQGRTLIRGDATMKRASLVIVLALAAVIAGCPKKNTAAGDGGAGEGGATATVGPPTNADDITRYPYEKKIDNEAATTARDNVVVHKSPPDGTQVATIGNGANVIKIASTSGSFLITFDDPQSGKRMM